MAQLMPMPPPKPPPVNICQIVLRGYPHSHAFDEVIESLQGALQIVGREVAVTPNALLDGHVNIVIGASLLTAEQCAGLGGHAIIYNLEQIDRASTWLTPHYRKLLARVRVLDYTDQNSRRLKALTGNENVRVLPVAYWQGLSRIPAMRVEDIDVLFYGSMNPRRQKIIDSLRDRGHVVAVAFGLYGTKRDELIARAKLVLNIHYYESSVFEVVRVMYLLANRKAVVAERGMSTEVYPWLQDCCRFAAYDDLIEQIEFLLSDDACRQQVAEQGYQSAARYPLASFLEPLLDFMDDGSACLTKARS